MPLISHRGAAHLGIQNSASAIYEGSKYLPDYIELDVNCTYDDVLVIYHGSISRFLHGRKTKETYAELKQRYPEILTLEELCALQIKVPILFDIKIADSEGLQTTIALIKSASLVGYAFTSPHESSLIVLQKSFPSSMILQTQPYHHGPISALEIARKNNFSGVMLNKWWLSPLVYLLCKIHRKQIGAYTIDSALAIWVAQRVYPGLYIVTNKPHVYRKLFPIATE